jgi:GAF domain-containing protein
VDREVEALRCVELWHRASMEVPEFERVSREFTFVPGLGLPGRVWSKLEPTYISDVVPDENFPRGPIAKREGLHAAFGFPILLGGEVLGVIEFFSREIRQPDQELLDMLATIGSQIGQFIERKRAEAELRESEQNYRTLFESIDEGFARLKFCLTRTKSRSITVFCKSARRLSGRPESRMPLADGCAKSRHGTKNIGSKFMAVSP